MQAESKEGGALSVSGAMALAKGALESVTVRIVGEVSELSNKPGYKAVYFTVKDASASLPCMMWNNRYRASGVDLKVGALVEIVGRFTLYAAKGRMNFDVFSVELAGEGKLRQQVAMVAKRLHDEGLMAPERKRAVPEFPESVGIVTSPRGAAVHDMLRTLRRRYPCAKVYVAGVPVEGEGAPLAIIEGLRAVVRAHVDVILLGRGGGSFEDLMPFNDERLARAVAACPIPIVTGIGHEPDNSIVDMVSDLRASTPTAAAEAVVPSREDLDSRIAAASSRASLAVRSRLQRADSSVAYFEGRPVFKDPRSLYAGEAFAIDAAHARLSAIASRFAVAESGALESLAVRLRRSSENRLEKVGIGLDGSCRRLALAGSVLCDGFEKELALSASRLNDLSPLAVISRGYAVARGPEGAIMKSVEGVREGDPIEVHLSDGRIRATVNSATKESISLESLEVR